MSQQEIIRRASARIRKLEEQREALWNALQDAREEIVDHQGHCITSAQCDKVLEETKKPN